MLTPFVPLGEYMLHHWIFIPLNRLSQDSQRFAKPEDGHMRTLKGGHTK